MRRVFVETGGFVAFLVAEDKHHAQAAALFERAAQERWALATTNAVVVETYSVLPGPTAARKQPEARTSRWPTARKQQPPLVRRETVGSQPRYARAQCQAQT